MQRCVCASFLTAIFLLTQSHAANSRRVASAQLPDSSSAWTAEPAPGSFYLFVNKEKNELSVRSLSDGKIVYKTYRAISGTNPGDKEKEGDKKTPEGIYFIKRRIPQKVLASLHGAAAFELNYPNPVDSIMNRKGSGIWIHGVDNEDRMSKRFDTRGCVALGNRDVLDLAKRLVSSYVPVVIVANDKQEMQSGWADPSGPWGQRVQAWGRAWASKDADQYLSFYDKQFYAHRMNFDRWSSYKRRLAKNYKSISVKIDQIQVLTHGKYAVAIFNQKYKSNRFDSSGVKRLYLLGSPNNAKILSEEMLNGIEQSIRD